jgi:hypothetical protein
MEHVLTNQVCPDTGQLTFVATVEFGVKQIGHAKVEDRITQKLKPLVMITAKTFVGDRPHQE